MSGSEDNKSWFRYRDAMSASTKLMQQDENEEALRLLDGAIAMAISENETRWVLTLSHHADVISNFLGSLSRVKHYYEKSLTFNPENPGALAGLQPSKLIWAQGTLPVMRARHLEELFRYGTSIVGLECQQDNGRLSHSHQQILMNCVQRSTPHPVKYALFCYFLQLELHVCGGLPQSKMF